MFKNSPYIKAPVSATATQNPFYYIFFATLSFIFHLFTHLLLWDYYYSLLILIISYFFRVLLPQIECVRIHFYRDVCVQQCQINYLMAGNVFKFWHNNHFIDINYVSKKSRAWTINPLCFFFAWATHTPRTIIVHFNSNPFSMKSCNNGTMTIFNDMTRRRGNNDMFCVFFLFFCFSLCLFFCFTFYRQCIVKRNFSRFHSQRIDGFDEKLC